ncbi:MAG: serpin family protein [Flavonifractor plautii]
MDPEGQISEEFIGRCMGIYGAEVFQGELSAPAVVDNVNRWVSKQTEGLIPKLVQQPFPEDTAALLINALYLNNTWELAFDPNSTYPREFTHSGGQVERMDFLHHSFTDLLYSRARALRGWCCPTMTVGWPLRPSCPTPRPERMAGLPGRKRPVPAGTGGGGAAVLLSGSAQI